MKTKQARISIHNLKKNNKSTEKMLLTGVERGVRGAVPLAAIAASGIWEALCWKTRLRKPPAFI